MAIITFKTLRVRNTSCEYFRDQTPDIYKAYPEKLEKGKEYRVTALDGLTKQKDESGNEKNYTWQQIAIGEGRYYVVTGDNAELLNTPTVESEATGKGATVQYNHNKSRYDTARENYLTAQNKLAEETRKRDEAIRLAQLYETQRHAAEEDARRITEEIDALRVYANAQLAEMNTTVAQKVAEQQTFVNQKGKTITTETDSKLAKLKAEAQRQFDKIMKQLDKMRDPAKGLLRPAEEIAESLFNLHREEGLTADEYDLLKLLATAYDARALSAYIYAVQGKQRLEG